MATPLDAVLFDLDGTLLDTAPDFHWVINRMREQDRLPAVSQALLRQHISNGAGAMVCAAYGIEMESAAYEPLRQRMLTLYGTHLAVDTAAFSGILPLLDWLDRRQVPWGVVTNKPELYTRPVLEGLGLLARCASIICPDHVQRRKPDPEPLLRACEEIGCRAENAVYIGDHSRDIECGRRAGMRTLGALYGYLDAAEDPLRWQADHYVQCASEIRPLLQSVYAIK